MVFFFYVILCVPWTGGKAKSFLNFPSRCSQPSSQSPSWLMRTKTRTSLPPRSRWFLMCVTLMALVVLCQSLKNICTILGCLSDRLTSLEKGQSDSPVPNPQALTPPGAGVLILTRPGRGESQTDSDDESNFCVEVRDADEKTDDPDILTLLEEDVEVGERLGQAVAEKLGTIARGRFTVRLPEEKLKDKLSKYPPPENCQELKTPST